MDTKNDKNRKIQEPFPPDMTPNPPQIIDPSRPWENNEKRESPENIAQNKENKPDTNSKGKEKKAD